MKNLLLTPFASCFFSASLAIAAPSESLMPPPTPYLAVTNLTLLHVSTPSESPIQVMPDRDNWTYALGDKATFRITVNLSPYPKEGVNISYKLGPEKYEGAEKTAVVPAEGLTLEAGTRTEPGFTRCTVTATLAGKKERGLAAAAYAPEKLLASATEPADFDAFWTEQKAALAKIPIEPELIPAPQISTPEVEVFYVSVKNIKGRFYGLLSVPRGPGPFPAAMSIPGSGVYRRGGDSGAKNDIPPDLDLANHGVIVLQVGVHGIPLNLPPELYTSLESGALSGYFSFNSQDRERYYFHRVLLGCLRMNDYLVTHPKWDGKNLIVKGGSQGGMLAIMTAALDPRVTAVSPYFPAAGGVKPPTGSPESKAFEARANAASTAAAAAAVTLEATLAIGDPAPPKIPAADYYDTINFARRLKVPGFYAWGYNDEACVPTTTMALYNFITAPKELVVILEGGHGTDPAQKIRGDDWIARQAQQSAPSHK